jgi:hypothetical protein
MNLQRGLAQSREFPVLQGGEKHNKNHLVQMRFFQYPRYYSEIRNDLTRLRLYSDCLRDYGGAAAEGPTRNPC